MPALQAALTTIAIVLFWSLLARPHPYTSLCIYIFAYSIIHIYTYLIYIYMCKYICICTYKRVNRFIYRNSREPIQRWFRVRKDIGSACKALCICRTAREPTSNKICFMCWMAKFLWNQLLKKDGVYVSEGIYFKRKMVSCI